MLCCLAFLRGIWDSISSLCDNLNGVDGGGNVALWRPGPDIRKSGSAQLFKASGISGCFFHQFSEGIDVTAAKDELGTHGSDEVARGSTAVAGRDRASATHGLIDDDAERLKLRGQNQQVRGRVNGRELRLVDEPEETDARGYAEAGGFRLELGKKRAGAGVKEERVRKIGFRERSEKIERTLPRLEFGREKNDRILRRNAP